jgi:hypothetical protein
MNAQENQLLRDFLAQLTQAQVGAKDPEVEALINRAVVQQPDAPYLLVQRALLLERALQQARAQLASQQERSGFFPGGGDAWSQAAPRATPYAPISAQATMAAPQAQSAPPIAPPASAAGAGWNGLLGNAAATAAGVAGGAFLFQGLEGLFGHHGGGISGQGAGVGAGGETVENVTVNNYANDAGPQGSDGFGDSGGDRDDDIFDDNSSWT